MSSVATARLINNIESSDHTRAFVISSFGTWYIFSFYFDGKFGTYFFMGGGGPEL